MSDEKSRKFRLVRKVKTEQPAPPPPPEPEVPVLPEDDADPGTPEMDRSLKQGCNGCIRVTGLVFAIMLASIIGTCFINWGDK